MKKICIMLFLIIMVFQVFVAAQEFSNDNWFTIDGCGADGSGRIGMSNTVFSVLVNGNDLYVAGSFTGTTGTLPANDAPLNRIAHWDGTKWNKFNDAVTSSSNVNCLALHNNNLYAGGYITQMDTTVAKTHRGIARWSIADQKWYPLDKNDDSPDSNGLLFEKNVNGYVNKILPVGDTLYIGGYFGGPAWGRKYGSQYFIAYNTLTDSFVLLREWDEGTNDFAANSGLRNVVYDIVQNGDDLYIAGSFHSTSTGLGFPAHYIVRYNIPTNTYHHLTDTSVQALNNRVTCLAIRDNYLYAGGWFNSIRPMNGSSYSGDGDSAQYIAKYNLTTHTWSKLSPNYRGLDNWVYAMKIHDDNLYIGGAFRNIVDNNGVAVDSAVRIVKYNITNDTFVTMGDGALDTVLSLDITADGTKLYAGGYFSQAGDKKARYIAGFYLVPPAEGDGSPSNPFKITNWEELYNIRNYLGAGHSGKHFKLMNNIDSTTAGYDNYASSAANGGSGWEPIGSNMNVNAFQGTFDGDSKTISDLYINRTGSDYLGLFGYAQNSTIKNVGLINLICNGRTSVGGLVGINYIGTITNSYVRGKVTCNTGNDVGGMIGFNWGGTITNSYAEVEVRGSQYIGGLVGRSTGTISNCYASGEIANYGSFRGGLLGKNDGGAISNCFAVGKVPAAASAGGLIGSSTNDNITNSFFDIYTTGQSTSAGGAGAVGLYTANMVDSNIFVDSGWNFDTIWTISPNQSYPYFKWQQDNIKVATAYSIDSALSHINGGTITISADTQFAGGTVSISITTNPGYEFNSWTFSPEIGTLAGTTDSVTTFTFANSNITVTANLIYSGKWYVDAAAGNDFNNGVLSFPLQTITKALTYINEGETIIINTGLYNEALTITVNNIYIIGTDSSSVIIDPPGDSTDFNNFAVKFINVSGITMSNLTVKDAYYGIYLDGCDSSLFENISVINCNGNAQSVGFYFYRNSDSVTIINSYFENNSRSIQSWSSAGIQYKNHILNNNFFNNQRGILLSNMSEVQIKNNIFYSGTATAVSMGSGFVNGIVSDNRIDSYVRGIEGNSGSGSNYIFNNIIENISTISSSYGIILNSDFNIIDSNTIYAPASNSSYPIYLESSAETNHIINNTVTGISKMSYGAYERGKYNIYTNNRFTGLNCGILWLQSSFCTATQNVMSNNAKGMVFNDGDSIYVYDNEMSNNEYGIDFLTGSDFNKADSNLIINNQYGINLGTSSYNRFENNYIANSQYGIKSGFSGSYSLNNIFYENIIYNSSHSGFYLEYIKTSVLTNNTVDSWVNFGIYISQTDGNYSYGDTITNNIITSGGNSVSRNAVLLRYTREALFDNNHIESNNARGINVIYSDSIIISNNMFENNLGQYMLYMDNSNYNTIFNNTFNNNGSIVSHYGVYLTNSEYNNFTNNIINGNIGYGLYYAGGSNNNTFKYNSILANERTNYCVGFAGGNSNIIELNTIITNATALIFTNVNSNIINNNNIYGTSSSLVSNITDAEFDITNNYWISVDSGELYNDRFSGDYKNKLIFIPFRFSEVDTSINADTISPSSTVIIEIDTSIINQLTLKWDSPVYTGESDTGLAGFNIFRVNKSDLINGDTGNWYSNMIGSVSASETMYIDNTVEQFESYYYRVTAFDSHTANGRIYYNESWFSDTVFSGTLPLAPNLSGIWYVNGFTGDDIDFNGSETYPFKTINKAMSVVSVGDTVMVAEGTYSETVTIPHNNISFIGADSITTIIDYNDSSAATGAGIFAQNKEGLLIKNIQIRNTRNGIEWNNVNNSRIENVYANYSGLSGIYLRTSDTNTLINNKLNFNNRGIYLFDNSKDNRLEKNITNYNEHGINIQTASHNNILTDNTALFNSCSGLAIQTSNKNILTNNTANSNLIGISLSISSNNILTNNIANSNDYYGINLSGHPMDGYTTVNTLMNNTINWNNIGIYVSYSSSNYFSQNTIDSNTEYIVHILNTSSSCTFVKNNIITSVANPDSAVLNVTANTFDFTNNYWSTTDSAVIAGSVVNTAGGTLTWLPFRLGEVDTAVGADTIGPLAPDTVAAFTLNDTSILIQWSPVTLNEDATVLTDLNGYRIYRSLSSAPDDWGTFVRQTDENTLSVIDYGLEDGLRYYYRVTAYDNNPIENESFYSDSIASALAIQPDIKIQSPVANYDTNVVEINIHGTAKHIAEGETIAIFVEDTLSGIIELGNDTVWSGTVQLTGIGNQIRVELYSIGNVYSDTVILNYFQHPVLSITSHDTGISYTEPYYTDNRNIVLSGTSSNTKPGDTISVYLNNEIVIAADTSIYSHNGNWTLPEVVLDDYINTVVVQVTDNWDRSLTDTVYISVIPHPSLSIQLPELNTSEINPYDTNVKNITEVPPRTRLKKTR